MNHYKTLMLVMFFLFVFCLGKINASIRNYGLFGRCIYVDAGHGGRDSGALSNTFMEKDMNLILSNKLALELFSRGAMLLTWLRYGKPDVSMTFNASLAGLVGITAGCDAARSAAICAPCSRII